MRHAVVVFLLAACGTATGSGTGTATSTGTSTSTAPTRPPLPAGRVVDGCFVTDEAPDPWACATADDCVAGGLLEPTCCMSGMTHTHSRAYHEWQVGLFHTHCDGTCMASPSLPLECQMAARCVEGRCMDSCDVPTGDGALDAMDESELEAACARGVSAACDRLGH